MFGSPGADGDAGGPAVLPPPSDPDRSLRSQRRARFGADPLSLLRPHPPSLSAAWLASALARTRAMPVSPPDTSSTASSSLYAGILSAPTAPSNDPLRASHSLTSSHGAPIPPIPEERPIESFAPRAAAPAAAAAPSVIAPPKSLPASSQSQSQPWSAALRFAPRAARKRPSSQSASSISSSSSRTSSWASTATSTAPSSARTSAQMSASLDSIVPPPPVRPRRSLFDPPPLSLPDDELRADRIMARSETERWGSTAADPQPAPPHKRQRIALTSSTALQTVNMQADYDPRVPNKFTAYVQLRAERDRVDTEHDWKLAEVRDTSQSAGYTEPRPSPSACPPGVLPPGSPPKPPPFLVRSAPERDRSSSPPNEKRHLPSSSLMRTQPATGPNTLPGRAGATGFAERMMALYGYRAGQGLGVGRQGITEPLLVRVEGPEERRVGRIVDLNPHPMGEGERDKYGKASEAIHLSSARPLEPIADEILHMHVAHRGAVLVRYAGPAGAWRAVRELDGRCLLGYTLRARYYPLALFDREVYEYSEP